MHDAKVLEIAKAFSDGLRVRIVEELSSGKPKRYTEVMKALGLDVVEGSSKFAYHMGILTEAGIAEKIEDNYRITQGGKEIFQAMVKVAEGWPNYRYQDSLKRIEGKDINKLLWSRTLLFSSFFWLAWALSVGIEKGLNEYSSLMLVVGSISFILGAYWAFKLKRDFWDPQWEKFLEACRIILGRNGLLVSLVTALNMLALIFLQLIVIFMYRDFLKFDLFTLYLASGCFGALILSIYLSKMLTNIWDGTTYGIKVNDYGVNLKIGYTMVLGIIGVVGGLMIVYGLSESSSGHIGAGIGCLGGGIGIRKEYKKIQEY
jgi:DNA-binding transcriptional ArsR family regulator